MTASLSAFLQLVLLLGGTLVAPTGQGRCPNPSGTDQQHDTYQPNHNQMKLRHHPRPKRKPAIPFPVPLTPQPLKVVPAATLAGMQKEYEYIMPSLEAFPTGREQEFLAIEAGFIAATHHELAAGLMGWLVVEK